MVERFKAHAWKACEVNTSAGSNPVLCAIKINDKTKFHQSIDLLVFFCYHNSNIRKSDFRFCNPKGVLP